MFKSTIFHFKNHFIIIASVVVFIVTGCSNTSLRDKIKHAEYLPQHSIETIPYKKSDFSDLKQLINTILKQPLNPNFFKLKSEQYTAELITEDQKGFWYLSPIRTGKGPYIIIARNPERNLVLEAAHPIKDRLTGIQSVLLLKALRGRAAIISGNNRCAAMSKSHCDGRTSVCGGIRESYPISDPSHYLPNMFHSSHVLFAKLWPKALFIQLHGFSGRETKTLFVLSDGSMGQKNNAASVVNRVRDSLRKSLKSSKLATSCQDLQDNRYKYRRVCGHTNIQGRHLNLSPDICHKGTFTTTNRFLHIEQQWLVREQINHDVYDAESDKLQGALIKSLLEASPCIKKCSQHHNK